VVRLSSSRISNGCFRIAAAIGVACSLLCLGEPQAADLTIGFKAEVTSADPHVLNGQNRNIWTHVYDTLIARDAHLQPKPALATSWRTLDDVTWEFKLRPNVVFSDGSPLTAKDVKFSIDRAIGLTGPRTFRSYLKDVASVSATSSDTVIIKTKYRSATLPNTIGLIPIVCSKIGDSANEAAFAAGTAAIGSGPYKYVQWDKGERVVLARNDRYWGPKEPWDKVTFQFISSEAARAAAMLAGSVDVIDSASSGVAEAFRRSDKVDTVAMTSYMLNYVQLDQTRDQSPYVKALDDRPLTKNPFKDSRVRQALAHMINRDLLIKRVMKGDADATGQLVPSGFFGYDPKLNAPEYNPAKAKSLLKEAGYPDGFKLTLHCPNDRYLNDAKTCESLAQMFTQGGIQTTLQTLPFPVFLSRLNSGGPIGESEFSAFLVGQGTPTGDSIDVLFNVLRSYDTTLGSTQKQYSNGEVDKLIDRALQTLDASAREELQQAAARLAVDDVGVIPLYHLKASWAVRKGLVLSPRSDDFTLATDIRPR
jgi:peptide/nickel transport system substrate-binding protein